MSVSSRATALLFAIISTALLFAVFALVTRLQFLAEHSYQLDYGWQQPASSSIYELCAKPLVNKGFPLTTQRPANDPEGCLDQTNSLASSMNLVICFAAAAIISAGAASIIRSKQP